MEMEIPSVRVLVVGDSGVGKTALLAAICRESSASLAALGAPAVSGALPALRWTTGCDAHVLVRPLRFSGCCGGG
jgi:ABC-type molybdenum transport system ATPase subunit/photorepair protein PhrA